MPENTYIVLENIIIDNTIYLNPFRLITMVSLFIGLFYLFFSASLSVEKLHKTYFILFLVFTIPINIILPHNFGPDEQEHFTRSYQLSYFDFGFTQEKEIPWPADHNPDYFRRGIIQPSSQQKIDYEKLFDSKDNSKKAPAQSTAASYLFFGYIPGAIGIFLGRLLNLGFVTSYYLGRISSTIFGAIFSTILLKKIKKFKYFTFLLFLMPALLYQNSFYTLDSMTFYSVAGIMVTFVNMILKEEHSLHTKDCLIFLSFILLSIVTKPTYFPLVFLTLLIPNDKFASKKQSVKLKTFVFVLVFIFTIFAYIYPWSFGINVWKVPESNAKEQLFYIITSPFQYIKTMSSTFFTSTFSDSITYLATFYSYSGYNMSFWSYVATCILLLTVVIEEPITLFSTSKKIVVFIAMITSVVLIFTALYLSFTPVGYGFILGVQGRYLLPLFVSLPLITNNHSFSCNWSEKKKVLIVTLISCIFLIFGMKFIINVHL